MPVHGVNRQPPYFVPSAHPTGGQWKRAVDMLEAMAAGGQHAQQGTALAVFKALADRQQADKALELLEVRLRLLCAWGSDWELGCPASRCIVSL